MFVEETEMKRPQWKHKRGLQHNIKMDLKAWTCNVDRIRPTHGKVQWLLLPKAVCSSSTKGDAFEIP
jgi:hypothetical protein